MVNNYALITGSAGLLGTALNEQLISKGYTTIGLKHRSRVPTDIELNDIDELSALTTKLDIVINLAGASIAGGIWSQQRKKTLENSRVQLTSHLIESLRKQDIRCEHFISGSAVGYYGPGTDSKSETDPNGNDFSAMLCRSWESAALEAQTIASYVTMIRTGLVLSNDGGYLKPLVMTSKLGLGSIFGGGHQGQSWIHIKDWLDALLFIIEKQLTGPVNLTAPNPVSQKDLMQSLSEKLNRPLWLKTPSIMLALTGEMKTLFLEGQYVVPAKLRQQGFQFSFPTIHDALTNLISTK